MTSQSEQMNSLFQIYPVSTFNFPTRIISNLKAAVHICSHVLALFVAAFVESNNSFGDKCSSTEIIFVVSSEIMFRGCSEVGLSPVLFVTEVMLINGEEVKSCNLQLLQWNNILITEDNIKQFKCCLT